MIGVERRVKQVRREEIKGKDEKLCIYVDEVGAGQLCAL